MNQEGTVLCMRWDETDPYQHENTRISKRLVDFFFQRELKHLQIFQDYSWAPKLLEYSIEKREIYIEWNKETLNHILTNPKRNLNEECPDWKEQLFKILQDVKEAGYYKVALYPHCFFIDVNKKIKTFDFYSCVGIEERYILRSDLDGMIGEFSNDRFNLSTVEDKVDFSIFFEITMKEFLGSTWSENPFPEFYEMLK
jgi:hypothetical protein